MGLIVLVGGALVIGYLWGAFSQGAYEQRKAKEMIESYSKYVDRKYNRLYQHYLEQEKEKLHERYTADTTHDGAD